MLGKNKKVRPLFTKKERFGFDAKIIGHMLGDVVTHPVACVIQAFMNCRDAGAEKILLNTLKNTFTFIDNGIGADDQQILYFIQLGASGWFTQGIQGAQGQFGTGLKSFTEIAEYISVLSIPKKNPNFAYSFDTTSEQLKRGWANPNTMDIEINTWRAGDIDFPFKHGTMVQISQFKNGLKPNDKDISEETPKRLSPIVVSKILFNGKKIKPRKIRGKKIQGNETFRNLDIDYDIGVTLDPKDTDFELNMGAINPVMPLSEFLRHVKQDELKKHIPPFFFKQLFMGVALDGYINVTKFNLYAIQGRIAFSGKLWNSEDLINFIFWLKDLGARIEKIIGKARETKADESSKGILAEFCQETQELSGFARIPYSATSSTQKERQQHTLSTELKVIPTTKHCAPNGEEAVFELINYQQHSANPSLYLWNTENAGGTFKNTRGLANTYRPGSRIGEYSFEVIYKNDPRITTAGKIVITPTGKVDKHSSKIIMGNSVWVQIDDYPLIHFELEIQNYPHRPMTSETISEANHAIIYINKGHRSVAQALHHSSAMAKFCFRHELVRHYVNIVLTHGTIEEKDHLWSRGLELLTPQ